MDLTWGKLIYFFANWSRFRWWETKDKIQTIPSPGPHCFFAGLTLFPTPPTSAPRGAGGTGAVVTPWQLLSAASSSRCCHTPVWVLFTGHGSFRKHPLALVWSSPCSRYWPWCLHFCFSRFFLHAFSAFVAFSPMPEHLSWGLSCALRWMAGAAGTGRVQHGAAPDSSHRGHLCRLLTAKTMTYPIQRDTNFIRRKMLVWW